MKHLPKTPLEDWTRARLGLDPHQRFTRDQLQRYQLERLNQTLNHAVRFSPYYRRQLKDRSAPRLGHLKELAGLPLTSPEALRRSPLDMVCGSLGEVARVVTLPTSGTTGDPKRIFFSDADLVQTVDFFQHGMATLVRPGQRVLILLPGDLPDSVGALLQRGLAHMGVTGIVHGPAIDTADTIGTILDRRIDCLVGIPVQVLALVRHPESERIAPGVIQSVLLSTDYVPCAIVTALQEAWGCEVFQHYGMTEMGYGGAVECAAHCGYHLREADLLFEIIDPITERPVDNGRLGEVVFTTLTRNTMPLIRYRTGDLAAWIDGPCRCGSVLRCMGYVQGRLPDSVRLAGGFMLDLASLDEALFALPGTVDFKATLHRGSREASLEVTLFAIIEGNPTPAQAAAALQQVPSIQAALARNVLALAPVSVRTAGREGARETVATGPVGSVSAGSAVKRRIVIQETRSTRYDQYCRSSI